MRPTFLALLTLLVTPAAAQTTSVLTSSSAGIPADAPSLYAEISRDARFVAWQSVATTLVPGDANGRADVFRREIATGTTELVSLAWNGAQGDQDSLEPELSADGRCVTFFSYATNLVPGDTNAKPDVFVRDTLLGTTELVSIGLGGAIDDGGNRYPTISHDGRFVAWESLSTNLVAGDTNGLRDVFVRDRLLGTTSRVSVASDGSQGNGDSSDANISGDGRYVAFESDATNLVPGDTNGVTDVFVHDLWTGITVRASLAASGAQGLQPSNDPYLCADGRCVAFDSRASTLVPGDNNGQIDIFVKDLLTGAIERCSVDSAGVEADWDCYDPVLSPDGERVVFFSLASNLVPGDTNVVEDIFLHERTSGLTERVSVGDAGQQGNDACFYPALSADGRLVAFDSFSSNLVAGDANGTRDIFLRERFSIFHSFCAGDGTLATPCPCANGGAPGRGCDNSASTGGARLVAAGTVNPDQVRFDASGELASSLSIFLQGDSITAAGSVFGDGVRCVAGALKRLYAKNAVAGVASAPVGSDLAVRQRSAQLGDPIPAGATRWYQVYYRDPNAGFCPTATFNVSNGVRVGW